jgi:uncharacterized membrane protein YphA (DoxX/SURF4 family)
MWTDWALLLLRLLIALLFAWSGWSHVTQPVVRGRSIGMSPAATVVLGSVELLGAAAVAVGVLVRIGAVALAVIMVGAIGKKIFAWHKGFWGTKNDGWYYDLLYLACNLVIAATGGGAIRIVAW